VQARFLLGPAGSGKTFRCLATIRAELIRDPAGPPLLLLAPKQATFQLERQLLDNEWWRERDGDSHPLPGYTRLQILSFERLARFILTELSPATPQFLDDEGRIMVLRALLARHRNDLKLFRSTARLPGFATRLSTLLRELQRQQLSPRHLDALAEKINSPPQLRDKLHDFARLLRGYQEWLKAQALQDADGMLDAATARLRADYQPAAGNHQFQLAGLWMDGFAEMTAQELDLLAAVLPLCQQATLAFCLDGEPQEEPSWLSTWSVIGQTYLRCRERVRAIAGVHTTVELLPAKSQPTRFTAHPDLAWLEANWSKASAAAPAPRGTPHQDPPPVALFACANPETEAVLAAREVRQFVRKGGRYREAAVIVRSLAGYADTLRRVFARYDIPCFIDRREPVAHHPLAELTRYALRLGAYGWRQADWFGVLKTGLAPAAEGEIDWLENLALEFGWDGNTWLQPLTVPEQPAETQRAERLRQKLLPPFSALAGHTLAPLSGKQLAAALRQFWDELRVEETLERWTDALTQNPLRTPHTALHSTVLDQLHAWLENLERAFPSEALDMRDWLPILEAGLATLTVGVIPPALDQVLIGAIDRSRNPELKLALIPGLNEGVFPEPPREDPLLNELERDVLSTHGTRLGPDGRRRLGHEWFYGYIACTRAQHRVVLTCAQNDALGNPLNRSPFFDRLARIFPDLELQTWQPPGGLADAEHLNEIIAPAIQLQATPGARSELCDLPPLLPVLARARAFTEATADQVLPPALVEQLHGLELATSVSGLEDFAACPFKFFVSRSLRAEERKSFELDPRERGSFQHDVLQAFHVELQAAGLKWRDVSPAEAGTRVRRIGGEMLAGYRHGLFAADNARRFAGELLLGSLETLITVLVTWAKNYRFDPQLVEAGFGLADAPWPAWKLPLTNGHSLALRGRVDRVDVWRDPSGAALAVVMDYKSSSRQPDRLKLYHGLQLQLPAYLNMLASLPEVGASLHTSAIQPAGVFYVNLRGEFSSAKSRDEALADPEAAMREGFQHQGRYDETHLHLLDPLRKREQFKTSDRAQDRMDSAAFAELLARAAENLQRFGTEIYSGRIAPEPFRKGKETACGFCEYASICRFDAWTQSFRPLKAPGREAAE
jgi:ATP-dependent helicase/nuclease subunit B